MALSWLALTNHYYSYYHSSYSSLSSAGDVSGDVDAEEDVAFEGTTIEMGGFTINNGFIPLLFLRFHSINIHDYMLSFYYYCS